MKNVVRMTILAIALGSLIIGYYYYLSHRDMGPKEAPAEEVSELDKVLQKDFANEYPETPRSVVKWYNRIISLYYDENTEDAQIEALCDQAMMLFDADLLQVNPREMYVAGVKADVMDYKTHNRRIVSTDVSSSGEVEYKEAGGRKYAYVLSYYFIKEGSDFSRTYQKFALRKDESGKWKILAFELTDSGGDPVGSQ
ncbi:MAG: hypothetical protein K5853_06455 [Lachnospiraceae bacterium]|nr:hypothetical protein [Lachnospiraceae bacterium]